MNNTHPTQQYILYFILFIWLFFHIFHDLFHVLERFIYSVFTKDTLDEKGQARDTSTHVTFNALKSTKNSPVAAGWNPQLLANWIEKKKTFQKIRLT